MKLVATIPPRRDGLVVLTTDDGQRITFKPDANGELLADVDDEALVGRLLRLGSFEPFDEADFDKATALLEAGKAPAPGGEDDGDDEGDDDAAVADAPPVEAKTPPKAAARPKAPARAAKPKR